METSITDVLLNIALLFISLSAAYALRFIQQGAAKLRVQAQQIKDEEQRNLTLTAIQRLESVAKTTVQSIEQTTAKELRSAVKGGVRDRDDLMRLSVHAFDEVVKNMEPEYLAVLSSTMGDVDAYIKNTIEAKLLEIKEAAA